MPPPCRAIQQSDEMYCAPCNLRWDVNDSDAPRCKPEVISAVTPDLPTRATLDALAKGYHDLIALRAEQHKTMARLLKLCIMRVEDTDSRKRREGIAGLRELMKMLEGQS